MNPIRSSVALYKRVRRIAYEDPERDWLLLATFALIVLAGIVVWNLWTFDTISNGGTLGVSPVTSKKIFDTTSLEKIHTLFETRAAEEAKYSTGVYRFVDPSQ